MRYGSVVAVDGVSFEAPTGAITAILGRNGQGKTSTVEACVGIRARSGGDISTLGCDPQTQATQLHPRVGVMLQDGGIPATARPQAYLQTLAAFYANPQPVPELLDRLGLAKLNRPFKRLSGGEQQRVKLAAALVGRPELVFLDEPSSGLDPSARIGMWELIDSLRRDGVSVVLTTHHLDEAETLADHVVILEGGHVAAEGSLAQLLGEQEVLRFSGPLHLDVDALTQVMPQGYNITEVSPGKYRVVGNISPQIIATVTTWCAQHGVAPQDLHTGRDSLESIFLSLTQGRTS